MVNKTNNHLSPKIQYNQRHTLINHCNGRITLLSDTDISFILFNLSLKFFFYYEKKKQFKKNGQQNKQSPLT
jgi:hypothetical protein